MNSPKAQPVAHAGQPAPPRALGIIVAAFGVLPLLLGISIAAMSGSPTFILIGLGVIASGVLVAIGKRAGLLLYGVTFVGILVAAVIEDGANVAAILPRVLVPAVLGLFLATEKTRARLR